MKTKEAPHTNSLRLSTINLRHAHQPDQCPCSYPSARRLFRYIGEPRINLSRSSSTRVEGQGATGGDDFRKTSRVTDSQARWRSL